MPLLRLSLTHVATWRASQVSGDAVSYIRSSAFLNYDTYMHCLKYPPQYPTSSSSRVLNGWLQGVSHTTRVLILQVSTLDS